MLHTALGVAVFRTTLAAMLADGVWDTMGNDRVRQLAVWFLAGGAAMLLLGSVVDAAERDGRPLPAALGWGLLALAVAGVVVSPRSGFWALVVAALGLVARARALGAATRRADGESHARA